MDCPACGEAAPEAAKWCEACGQDLLAEPVPPCTACGERDISVDGYCSSCGHKQPGERDHMVFEDGPATAVTDRGLRHRNNEDAAAIGDLGDGGAVLVVCDGVSSTPGSAEASLAAARAACDLLVAELGGGAGQVAPAAPLGDGLSRAATVEAALVAATKAAQAEAAAAPEEHSNAPYSQGGPPSSTFVAAVALPNGDGASISVAWLGDSRAYWVASAGASSAGASNAGVSTAGATALTEDHEIEGSLTRWIGADNVDDPPSISHFDAEGPGLLLLCSDGLWRYAETATELSSVVERLTLNASTLTDVASALVDFAIAGGGHDNITVALWKHPPARDERSESVGQVSMPDGAHDDEPDDEVQTIRVDAAPSTDPPGVPETGAAPVETDSPQESEL